MCKMIYKSLIFSTYASPHIERNHHYSKGNNMIEAIL